MPIQEMQVRVLGWEEPLKREMAIYSNILAWEIPSTEKPAGWYSPWGRKKVRQGLATKQQQIAQETIPSPANKIRTWGQTGTDRTTQWVINGTMPESEMASWKR